MAGRPKVVAFDIFETVLSLEPLREALISLGLPSGALETWFAAGLRDAFALAATDQFAPFRTVLEGAFDETAAHHKLAPSPSEKAHVLDLMKSLPIHPDAKEAFQTVRRRNSHSCTQQRGGVQHRRLVERCGP